MKTNLNIFQNIHKNETCVIIGNGPSLKLEHLEKLSKKYKTFGSNQIYRLPFTPTYYSMVDRDMIDACLPLPKDFNPTKFVLAEAQVKDNNPTQAIIAAGFSRDIDNFVVMGGTVTYVLFQLALFMGFKRLLLVGVDHYYPLSGELVPGQLFKAGETDPDHFDCDDGEPYFKTGLSYNAPELAGVTQSYLWANELFGQEGIKCLNLTPGTHLDIFEKDDIENWV